MKKLLSSRLVILAVVFVGLYAILGMRLFNLQIMEGEQYQENYMAKTEKKISLAGTAEIFMTETGIFLHIINCRTM